MDHVKEEVPDSGSRVAAAPELMDRPSVHAQGKTGTQTSFNLSFFLFSVVFPISVTKT